MAEPISIQQLKDASEDAITLADFIYKPANVMIPRRLAADINSLQYYLDYMSSYAQHSYETYDEMFANAVNLPNGVSAFVTNDLDTAKNGLYTYNGGSFVKGDYQPEKVAKDYVDSKLGGLQVFDGKVRAQDVSTKLPNISQETLNNGFSSVSEIVNLIPSYNVPSKVLVNGEQGGTFVYDNTKATINDGGAILNGWVREISPTTGWVTPQMFGAKADGVTYDELAISKCIKFAEKKKMMIWMGGKECVYLVKYAGETTTFGSIFNITEGFNMQGAGATIKVNQTPVSDSATTQYSLFRINRPTAEATNYQYLVKNIYFAGIEFEGGYIFENDTNNENLNDKHKLRAITAFETRTQNLNLLDCGFKDFAQNNTIVTFYSDSFNTYGIGKDVTIDKCRFVNCGYEGDHSTMYFMDDNVAITRCSFYIDKKYNNFGSHAVELHGKNSYMDRSTVTNYIGGLIFGTNTQVGVGLIGSLSATGNTFKTYSDAFSIWSGEGASENGIDDINITGNTATLIDYDGRLLELGTTAEYKAFLSTPITGKILGSVNSQDNIVISESSLPVYGADIAVGDGIQPELINFSNNTLKGIKSAVRVFSRAGAANVLYGCVKVSDNKTYHYENKGAFSVVQIETSNTVDSAVIRLLAVSGNTVSTFIPTNATLIDVKSGFVERITMGLNSLPQGANALSLNGANIPDIDSSQKLSAIDYLALPDVSAKTLKPSVDIIRYKIPMVDMSLAESGLKLSKVLGFSKASTRILKAVGKLSGGFSTSGIDVTAEIAAGASLLVAPVVISNVAAPFFGESLSAPNAHKDISGSSLSVSFGTYDAATITALKNSGLIATIELTVEKIF